jgi:sugar lactone lactonase YvrE
MEPVPTGVVAGPDGAFYVGELTGFPFAPGAARVWRVTAAGEATVYASGFTNVIDVAFDGAGNLYVLEMLSGGLGNADPENPATLASRLIRVAPDGTQTTVVGAGLTFATGLAIGSDGTVYVSNFGVMPGMGQVVALEGIAAPAGPPLTVLVGGLNNPRGLTLDDEGNVYVAQGGVGGETCIDAPGTEADPIEICFGASGTVERIGADDRFPAISGLTSLLDIRGDIVGVQDVALGPDGLLYATMGLGANPEDRADYPVLGGELGWIVSASIGTNALLDVDIAAYELANNPDGGALDSNPFSLVADGAGGWVVSDAGANALLHVDADGTISTLAVFPARSVEAQGAQVPMQAVPTGVTVGPDGAFYVGELTGFPFPSGLARVWRVTADGEASVYAEGFTNVIDVAFASDGTLYVLEMTRNGLLSGDTSAAVVRVMPDGSQLEVASSGLNFATGLAIGPDGTFYVSNFGVMPDMGQVVSFELN